MTSSSVAALIMAGGRSERMRAGGCGQHKGLRAVLGMPLIERNLRTLLFFGFRRLYVAINAEERGLAAWIGGPGQALAQAASATFESLVEREPRGTIGAVASLPRDVEDVVIVNVDNLTSLDLVKLAQAHREQRAAATIATHLQPFPIPFGMVELDGRRVVAYREKPALPVPISSGTYVLHRRAIDRVPPGRRMDVPALIEALLAAGEPVVAHPHEEAWIDVNDEAALDRAQGLLAKSVRPWPGAAEGRGEP